MGYSTGKGADSLQFLGLDKLFFQIPFLGNIFCCGQYTNSFSSLVNEWHLINLKPGWNTGMIEDFSPFFTKALVLLQHQIVEFFRPQSIFLVSDNLPNRPVQDALGGMNPEKLAKGPVRPKVPSLGIFPRNQLRDSIHQRFLERELHQGLALKLATFGKSHQQRD